MKDKKLFIEALYTTIATFVLIWLLTFLPFNLKIFDPFKKAFGDFEFTDLYFSNLRASNTTDSNIVLIDLDTVSRKRIAEIIDIVNENNPAVIGLDAWFAQPKDSTIDHELKSALARASSRLVVAGKFSYDPLTFAGSHEFFGKFNTGYINFVSDDEHKGAIRYFRPSETIEGKELLSFGVAVVQKFNPELARECLDRNERSMIINYIGDHTQFTTIFHEAVNELNPELSQLEGKIVLLGLAGDPKVKNSMEDCHFTPMNEELSGKSFPDTYGLTIHANIISMIVRGDYISKVPFIINLVIAFLLTYLHAVLYCYYFVKRHLWFHLVAKLTQFAASTIFIYVVILLIASFNTKFDSGLTLAGILLIVDVLYFYEAFRAMLHRKYHLPSYFIHDHH